LIILGTLVTGIGSVITAVGFMGAALTFLAANPIVLLIAAIAAIIAAGIWLIKNWDQVKAAAELVTNFVKEKWEGLKNKFDDLKNQILDAIMWPFNEAKKKIEETVEWIKDKLDFTQRHSPSVVDIVKNGVSKVNEALGDLAFGANLTANAAGAAVNYGGNQSSSVIVQVSLDGAVVADAYGAGQMGELLGDAIIKRLQQHVRV
jgi:hypothetical protein